MAQKRKDDTEELLREAYRSFLLELSYQIVPAELEKLKSLLKGKGGYGDAILPEIKTVLKLFDCMEEKDDLSPSNTHYLKKLLGQIHRYNLCKKVDDFQDKFPPKKNDKYPSYPEAADHLSMIQTELKDWYLYKLAKLRPIPWCEFMELQLDHVFTNLEIMPGQKDELSRSPNPDVFKTIDHLANTLWSPERRTVTQIEGVAGIGKSTLSRILAYTWADNNYNIHGFNFKLVILLECRVMDGNLKQCIYQQRFPKDFKLKEDSIYKCIEEYQNDILIIIDGVDELNMRSKKDVRELLDGQILRKAQLLFTGRPEATPDYVRFCDKHLRITGFSKQNTEHYIHKYFRPEEGELRDKLLDQIEGNTNLKNLTVNPFITLLVCILAQEQRGNIPTSQNEILRQITICVGKRYVSNYESIHGKGKSPDVNELLSAVRFLAFAGVESKTQVFEESFVIQKCPEGLISHILKSGLLTRDFTTSRLHTAGCCYFPHKSISDYLCAEYLADCSVENFNKCWMSVKKRNNDFMFTCLINLLGNQPDKMKIMITDITEMHWIYILPGIVEVNSQKLFIELCSSRYGLMNKMRGVIGSNGDLLPLLFQNMELPPVCRCDNWSDDVMSSVRHDNIEVTAQLSRPDHSEILLPTYNSKLIRDINITFPIENVVCGGANMYMIEFPRDVGNLNICYCLLTKDDFVNIRNLIHKLKQVKRSTRVFLVLMSHSECDYLTMRALGKITSTKYTNISLHVHVNSWLSKPKTCITADFPSFIVSRSISEHDGLTYEITVPTTQHRMLFDKYCPY